MKKYIKLKNVFNILKFFYNDTFNGILNRPFFKKKINRYGLISSIFLFYLMYFYLNMVQLSSLSNGAKSLSQAEHMLYGKITLSSYYNSFIIISSFIFIFIKSTIYLTRNSLFMVKTMPFTKQEVQLSVKIFKISVAIMLFELVLIIVAPALKLIPMNMFAAIIVLFSLHIVFLATFFILDLIYGLVIGERIGKSRFVRKLFLDLLVILLASVYGISLRFNVDNFVGYLDISILKIALIVTTIGILIIFTINHINNRYLIVDDTFIESKFFKLNLINVKNAKTELGAALGAFTRNMNFIYLWGIAIIITIISIVQNGVYGSYQSLLFLLPIVGVYAISYADSTISFRKMYNLYNITPLKELKSIMVCASLLTLPSLIVGILSIKSIDPYLYAVCIFTASTIIGFLFPKSQSNVNETISALLAVIVIIILSLLANIKGALFPALLLFTLILYLVLRKEYEVSK